uniref:Uncharacterized protein n=1 Tax=Oryza rufipogon TaxID=4529 RepID=A0A0E0Q583_ORYRU
MEQEQQWLTPPRFGLDAATIACLPSFLYVRAHDNGEVSDTAALVEAREGEVADNAKIAS